MLTTRTPNRISFLGGGTDYNSWFSKHNGIVIGAAINKYSFVSARHFPPYHDYKSRIVYSQIETVKDNADIEHRVINACIRYLGIEKSPLEIFHTADLPGRSGTGSSSTFLVGLLHSLSAISRKPIINHELAAAAIEIEQGERWLNETVGCQDQTFAAHGGLNIIRFRKDGSISVCPFAINAAHIDELQAHMMLFFTRIQRTSSEIAMSYVPAMASKEREQREMMRLAEEGVEAVYGRCWEQLGNLIDRAYRIKTSFSAKIVTPQLNRIHAAAKLGGAWGAKITGAGGGGCLLAVGPPENRKRIIDGVESEGCIHVPFKFDFEGSRIVYCDVESLKEYVP